MNFGAQGGEDVYSWLLVQADQLGVGSPGLAPLSPGLTVPSDPLQPVPSVPVIDGIAPMAPEADFPTTESSSPRAAAKAKTAASSTSGTKGRGTKKASGSANSKKRASGSSDSKESNPLAKRQKRLEKNRLSARECRRRKKEKVQDLEERVQKLEQENMQLRLQLRVGREALKKEEEDKWRITNQLEDMVKRNASDEAIARTIDMFKERYADYGKERQTAIRYHLDHLEKLLVPTQVTKMGLWSLHQEDEFYEEGQSAISSTAMSGSVQNSIWHILCEHLKVTDEQKARIKGHRSRIRLLCGELKQSLRLLGDLRGKVDVKNVSLEQEMKELQSILTPKQTAKFILWVSHNPACMQMLNKLWNTMGTAGNGTSDALEAVLLPGSAEVAAAQAAASASSSSTGGGAGKGSAAGSD